MSPYFNTHYSPSTPATNTEDIVLVWRDRYDAGLKLPWPLSSLIPSRITNRRRDRQELSKTQPRFQRGMIVVFRAPHDPTRITVKRIVALPGDIVTPLPGYTFPSSTSTSIPATSSSANATTVTIPWNHLWVEGDVCSREASLDSNWYGPISQSLVIGRVTHVLQRPWMTPLRIDHGPSNGVSLYPAEQSKRVQRDAVRTAHPNASIWKDAYLYSGLGERWLERFKEKDSDTRGGTGAGRRSGDNAETYSMMRDLRTPYGQARLAGLLSDAAKEIQRQDPESEELAGKLWDEAERWRRKLVEEVEGERARAEMRAAVQEREREKEKD